MIAFDSKLMEKHININLLPMNDVSIITSKYAYTYVVGHARIITESNISRYKFDVERRKYRGHNISD